MISEGSCDTEDWSNDAENTGIEKKVLTFYQYFDQIIAALVSRRAIFQKHLKKNLNYCKNIIGEIKASHWFVAEP